MRIKLNFYRYYLRQEHERLSYKSKQRKVDTATIWLFTENIKKLKKKIKILYEFIKSKYSNYTGQ